MNFTRLLTLGLFVAILNVGCAMDDHEVQRLLQLHPTDLSPRERADLTAHRDRLLFELGAKEDGLKEIEARMTQLRIDPAIDTTHPLVLQTAAITAELEAELLIIDALDTHLGEETTISYLEVDDGAPPVGVAFGDGLHGPPASLDAASVVAPSSTGAAYAPSTTAASSTAATCGTSRWQPDPERPRWNGQQPGADEEAPRGRRKNKSERSKPGLFRPEVGSMDPEGLRIDPSNPLRRTGYIVRGGGVQSDTHGSQGATQRYTMGGKPCGMIQLEHPAEGLTEAQELTVFQEEYENPQPDGHAPVAMRVGDRVSFIVVPGKSSRPGGRPGRVMAGHVRKIVGQHLSSDERQSDQWIGHFGGKEVDEVNDLGETRTIAAWRSALESRRGSTRAGSQGRSATTWTRARSADGGSSRSNSRSVSRGRARSTRSDPRSDNRSHAHSADQRRRSPDVAPWRNAAHADGDVPMGGDAEALNEAREQAARRERRGRGAAPPVGVAFGATPAAPGLEGQEDWRSAARAHQDTVRGKGMSRGHGHGHGYDVPRWGYDAPAAKGDAKGQGKGAKGDNGRGRGSDDDWRGAAGRGEKGRGRGDHEEHQNTKGRGRGNNDDWRRR